MDIVIYDNAQGIATAFTEQLKQLLSETETLNIALSGGSTPKALFDYWASLPTDDIDWQKVHLFWGDERCVPPTDSESNYLMTKQHLIDHINIPADNIHRILGEAQPEEEARRYATVLQKQLPISDGIPVFDLIMLGMGDDGHTASIFPHQMNLWDSNELCVVATHPTSGQQRISLTGKVINQARMVCFLVTGKNKADKLKQIIEQPIESEELYPAARVCPLNDQLIWYVDREAAHLITDLM